MRAARWREELLCGGHGRAPAPLSAVPIPLRATGPSLHVWVGMVTKPDSREISPQGTVGGELTEKLGLAKEMGSLKDSRQLA